MSQTPATLSALRSALDSDVLDVLRRATPAISMGDDGDDRPTHATRHLADTDQVREFLELILGSLDRSS